MVTVEWYEMYEGLYSVESCARNNVRLARERSLFAEIYRVTQLRNEYNAVAFEISSHGMRECCRVRGVIKAR